MEFLLENKLFDYYNKYHNGNPKWKDFSEFETYFNNDVNPLLRQGYNNEYGIESSNPESTIQDIHSKQKNDNRGFVPIYNPFSPMSFIPVEKENLFEATTRLPFAIPTSIGGAMDALINGKNLVDTVNEWQHLVPKTISDISNKMNLETMGAFGVDAGEAFRQSAGGGLAYQLEPQEFKEERKDYSKDLFQEGFKLVYPKVKEYQKWEKENNLIPEKPSWLYEIGQGVTYTTALMGVSMIPVVGQSTSLLLGMQTEGMDASIDTYDKAKEKGKTEEEALALAQETYNVMFLVGATEQIGFRESTKALKNIGKIYKGMLGDVLAKEGIDVAKREVNRELIKNGLIGYGKNIGEEVTQEVFSDAMNQTLDIKNSFAHTFDFDRSLHTALITIGSSTLMSGSTQYMQYNTMKNAVETVKTKFNVIDDLVKTNQITPEEGKVFKDTIVKATDSKEGLDNFYEQVSNVQNDIKKALVNNSVMKELVTFKETTELPVHNRIHELLNQKEFKNNEIIELQIKSQEELKTAKTEEEKVVIKQKYDKLYNEAGTPIEIDERTAQAKQEYVTTQAEKKGIKLNPLSQFFLKLESYMNDQFFFKEDQVEKNNEYFGDIVTKIEKTEEFTKTKEEVRKRLVIDKEAELAKIEQERKTKLENVSKEAKDSEQPIEPLIRNIEDEYQGKKKQIEIDAEANKFYDNNELLTKITHDVLLGQNKNERLIDIQPNQNIYIKSTMNPLNLMDLHNLKKEDNENKLNTADFREVATEEEQKYVQDNKMSQEASNEEIEQKRADIEKRRRTELEDGGRVELIQTVDNAKRDRDDPDSRFKDLSDAQIDEIYEKGLRTLNDFIRLARKKGISNEDIANAVINKINNNLVLGFYKVYSQMFIGSIEKGLDGFFSSKEINAKYDAELAALEQLSTNTTTLADVSTLPNVDDEVYLQKIGSIYENAIAEKAELERKIIDRKNRILLKKNEEIFNQYYFEYKDTFYETEQDDEGDGDIRFTYLMSNESLDYPLKISYQEYEIAKEKASKKFLSKDKYQEWFNKDKMLNSLKEELIKKNKKLQEIREFSEITERILRDLAANISSRIGISYNFINDTAQKFKGKLEKNVVTINLAYATLDTPIHEILGHPIIRAIKAKQDKKLYQNLLKELEYGKGKEVLDRIKRDYHKESDYKVYSHGINIIDIDEYGDPIYEKYEYYVNNDGKGHIGNGYRDKKRQLIFFNTEQEAQDFIKNNLIKEYTLEEQQEEAIVELLGLMTAEKLDAVKDGKLISLLKRLLKEIKGFVRELLKQREIEINKLPDNLTLNDLANILAYSNSNIILPGFEVEYTTPDNDKFKTYQEAKNHVVNLAKDTQEIDLSNVTINKDLTDKEKEEIKFLQDKIDTLYEIYESKEYQEEQKQKIAEKRKEREEVQNRKHTFNELVKLDNELYVLTHDSTIKEEIKSLEVTRDKIKYNPIKQFIERNTQYEQARDIIERWKEVNKIQYDPNEVYSRNQEFVSVMGAYSNFDLNLLLQNLLFHIEDNAKAGGEFVISAITVPVDKKLQHLDRDGSKVRIKIYPKSEDIKWAANADVYSGSVWNAVESVSNKESEIVGVSYSKYPNLTEVNAVASNLGSIIDELADHHNELGIALTGDNFRLEYDENISLSTKKLVDSVNRILEQKYGKIVKPEVKEEVTTTKIENYVPIHVVKSQMDFNKDYDSKALVNTKVAKLKEVAKKYPMSLISSEVKSINRDDPFNSDTYFQKATPIQSINQQEKVSQNVSNAVLEPSKRTVSEVMQDFESKGIVRLETKEIMDFLKEQVLDVEIKYVKNNFVVKGQSIAGIPGMYTVTNGKKYIYLNTDISNGISNNLYDTFSHELFHAYINEQINKMPELTKKLRELYNNVKDSVKRDTDFYNEHKNDLDRIFNDTENNNKDLKEFVTYVKSNTSILRDYMSRKNFNPTTTFLKRHYLILKEFILRGLGKTVTPTQLEALDLLLYKFTKVPTSNGFKYDDGVLVDKEPQLVADALGKVFSLSDELLQDIRGIQALNDLLAEDWNTKDVLDYIEKSGITKLEFKNKLKATDRFLKKLTLFYSVRVKKDITFDDYLDTVATYIYNQAKNSKNRTVIAVDLKEAKVITHSYNYKDAERKTKNVRRPLTLMDQYIGIINKLLGSDLSIVYIDSFTYSKTNNSNGKEEIFTQEAKKYIDDKGNDAVKASLLKLGYYFPGTWADKSTIIAFKINKDVDLAKVNAFGDLYYKAMQNLQLSGAVTEDYNVPFSKTAKVGTSEIIRTLIEDIKLGGRFDGENFQSALFNPKSKDTYDLIKIFKRAYVVAPLFTLNQENASNVALDVIQDTYGDRAEQSGIVINKDGTLSFRTYIFNVNSSDFVFEYAGKEYNIKQVLTDAFGTDCTDGAFIFGLGGFDTIWRKLSGSLKEGAIKLWGHNSLEGNFSTPFYLKTAGHGFNQKDIIVQWMRANNISLLVSDSATKVNGYGSNGLSNKIDQNIIELPLANLERIMEKDDHQETARGLKQSITANLMVENNPIMKTIDPENRITKIFKGLVDKLIEDYEQQATNIDGNSMLEYIKKICINPTNNRERAISNIFVDMLYTYADSVLQDRQNLADEEISLLEEARDVLEPETIAKREAEIKELLKNDKNKVTVANEALANKLGKILFHPYFEKLFESKMNGILEDLLFYEVPSTYSVICPDLGVLASTRYEAIQTAMKANIKAKEEIRDRQNEAIQKDIDQTQKTIDYYETVETTEPELKKAKIKELVKVREEFQAKLKTNQKEFSIDKMMANVTYEDSGRLKPDYTMLTQDIADRFNIKIGDNVLTIAVPSDSMQSMNAPYVVALLDKTQASINCIVCNSEYLQSQVGKDYDLDTLLVVPYSDKFKSLNDFQYLAESIRKIKGAYKPLIKKQYEDLLLRDITDKEVFSKAIRLEYLQALYGKEKSKEIYNPLLDQSLLDKYKKLIANIVNRRAMVTMKNALGFTAQGSFRWGTWQLSWNIDYTLKTNMLKSHVAHLGETNAQVDIPNDDTALKYNSLNPIAQYFIDNNLHDQLAALRKFIRTLDTKEQKKFEKALKGRIETYRKVDEILFRRLAIISSDKNVLEHGSERDLTTNMTYLYEQKILMNLLKTDEGKKKIVHDFLDKNDTMGALYLTSMNLKNDMNSFIPMYLINKTNLELFPSITQSDSLTNNLAVEEMTNTSPFLTKIVDRIKNTPSYVNNLNNIEKKYGKEAKFVRGMFLFTTVGKNPNLHLLKGKLLRVINSHSTLFANEKQESLSQWDNGLAVAVDNAIWSSRILKSLLTVNSLVINDGYQDTKTSYEFYDKELKFKGILEIEFQNNGSLRFSLQNMAKKELYSIYHQDLQGRLDVKDTKAMMVGRLLFDREGIFGFGKGKNRYDFSLRVNATKSINLDKRYDLANEILNEEYGKLEPTDKFLLWASLSATTTGELSNETLSNSGNNNRLWGLLEGLEDEESREFIKRYFGYYHNQITHGFNSVLEVKSAMYQDKDVDEEIYTMFGLESTDTTISQEADRMNDDKNKKPLDSAYILPVYNKNTGLKLMGLEDISSLVTPIDLLGKLRVNEIDAYKAGALTIIGEVEKIVTATKIAQLRITTLLNDVIRTGKFNTTDILKHTKIKQLKEQVFKAVEANTRGINIVKSTTGYTYSAQGLQAESAKELAVLLQLNPQDSSMFQIECEYHKLYSVDNIETISNIIGYLEDIFSRVTLPSQKHLIKSILDKYKRQEKALVSRKFNYMPHIIPENVYKTVVMLDMKRAEIEAIQQEIADAKAWQLANPNLPISKTYLDLIAIENDQEAINRMAVERIEKENSGYGVGSVGQYVNAHMLKRKYGTEISGITIVDMDTGIHSIHANQFIKAIKNDLLFVNHLLFENEYLMNGNNPDSKLFKRMLHHTAELTGNRLLASKEIDTKEIKAGMEISFFYPVAHKALNNFANMGKNYYSGTIKKVDAKFIYVKMDRKKFVGFINEKLKEYSRIHNNIKNSPLGITNATIGQLALIDDFINQGYLMPNFYPKTMIEASELIINTLQQILDNKESWGKFRKDNLYRRNLQGVKGQELASGVYRYLPYTNGGKNISTGINYLHGLARELNNRYDNKFHEEGWSSLANISTALGFIKYQALEILPNLTQGARWLQAKVGLSTPAAGLHNYLQGITSIMRDRGISNFVVTQKEVRVISNKVKIAMKENNIQYYIDIADNFLQNTNAQGYQESDKSNIIAGLAFKNMFESGVLFEDFLMNNITGDNTLIEKDVIKYTVNEKYNTIRQKIIDSVGYKKYKEEKSRIFEELIKETNPTKITSLMTELTKLENGWKIKKDEIFAKKEKFLSSFLSKAEIKSIKDINLSEAEDKTTTDIAKGVGLDFYHLPFFSYMIGTGFFSRVEGHLRRNATIFYILDEFNKGNFDETKIHNNVMKGIARTQAMYDDINRRLGDRSKIGKFFYMFGQYPMFTWDVYKRMIRAYKESDDPRDKELIRKKMVNEFAIDVMYTGANAMFQGLKLGHPVNLIGYSALIAMINLFGVLFDEPEEDDKNKSLLQRFMENYEMKEFIFSLLSFRLGMGHTLLLNMGYNAILGEEKRKEQTKKESIAKRDGKTVKPLTSVPPVVSMGRLGSTFQILERTNRLMYETITGNKAKVNAWQDKKDMRMFEKYFSPFNLLAPVGYKQADLDYYLYTQKTLAERLLQAGELAIPLFAGIKYKTDLPIYGTTTNAEYEKQLEQKAEERKKVNYQEHIDEMKAKGKGYIEIKEYEDQYRQRQSDIENGYKDSSGKLTEKGKRMRKGNGLFKFRF